MNPKSLAIVSACIKEDTKELDFYRYVAERLYGVPYDEVTAEQRKSAKEAVFWTAYGRTEKEDKSYG